MSLSPEVSEHSQDPIAKPALIGQIRDPVCGMNVDPKTASYRVEHGGTTTYFCSEHCRTKFLTDLDQYLKVVKPVATRSPPPASSGTSGVIYTCPMHPQIRRNAPGNCPICGMALEPLVATAEAGASPELRDMTRRFWIGTALALPVVMLEMTAHVAGMSLHRYLTAVAAMWIQFAVASPVVLWAAGRCSNAPWRPYAIARSTCSV